MIFDIGLGFFELKEPVGAFMAVCALRNAPTEEQEINFALGKKKIIIKKESSVMNLSKNRF